MNDRADRPPEFVQSLGRGLAVINSFSRETPSQTLSEVAAAAGLTRATARRVLLTLVELGYVRQDARNFSLTPRVLDLGYSFLSSFRAVDLAQAPMEHLAEELQESSSMSILDNGEVVYVARVPTKRIMTIALALGSRLPAYPTSMGRVLLAGLTEDALDGYLESTPLQPLTKHTITDRKELVAVLDGVRERGFAIVDQELEEGVRSIAAPITTADATVIAAINVSAHASRAGVRKLRQEYLPKLLEATAEVSSRVSASGVK